MIFLDAVVAGFANYLNFSARANRSEYWYFTLFTMLGSAAAFVLDRGLFDLAGGGPVGLVWGLATILPGLGVSVRRLHDIGRSGWMLLLLFIPLVGAIILLIWMCKKGDEAANGYGPPSTFGS